MAAVEAAMMTRIAMERTHLDLVILPSTTISNGQIR